MSSSTHPSLFVRCGVAIGKAFLPVAFFLWGSLSPRAARFWAWCFWLVSWPFLFGKRRVIRENLRLAFPEKSPRERRRIGHRCLLHFLGMGLDWLHLLKHPDAVEKLLPVSPEFRENCTAGNPGGRSPAAFYCTLHLGNWEMASRVSYLTGRAGSVVVARFRVPWFNELSDRLRKNGDDTQVIDAEGAGMGVLRALLAGRNVGILIDQNVSPRHGGVYENFFGIPATTSRLPATIVRKLQIPLYVVACVKQPDGTFAMDFVPLPRNAWEYPSDRELTAAIFRAYEELIRRHPEQYLWSYTRWRSIPANVPAEIAARYPSYAQKKKYECPPELFS